MTYDEIEAHPAFDPTLFAHDCDYTDPSCHCLDGPHAPGDTLCVNRHQHTACPHDLAQLAKLPLPEWSKP